MQLDSKVLKAFLSHIFFNIGCCILHKDLFTVLIFISLFLGFGSFFIPGIFKGNDLIISFIGFSYWVIDSLYWGFCPFISIIKFLSTELTSDSCWISLSTNSGLLCIIFNSFNWDMVFSYGIYCIHSSIIFGFDDKIFILLLFSDICGFQGLIQIFPSFSWDNFDIIFNSEFVILFSDFSGWIPHSIKSGFLVIILYSLLLSIIFSILIYWVHSSTFWGLLFFEIMLISSFILLIWLRLLFLFIFFSSSIWIPISVLGSLDIISNSDFVIWFSSGSCWISVSTNFGLLWIIFISFNLSIVFWILLVYWDPSSICSGFVWIIFISLLIFDINGFHFFVSLFASDSFSKLIYCILFSKVSGFIDNILISSFLFLSIVVIQLPIWVPLSSFFMLEIMFNFSFAIMILLFLFNFFPSNDTFLFSVINNLLNLLIFSSLELIVCISSSFFTGEICIIKSFFSLFILFISMSLIFSISYFSFSSLFRFSIVLFLNFSKIFFKNDFLLYSTIFNICLRLFSLFFSFSFI